MIEDFNIDPSQLDQYEVLIAAYSYENYSGSAFVLLRNINTDLLYEVNGGHCSCHGLESCNYSNAGDTQWDPEETTLEAIAMRQWYREYGDDFYLALSKIVGKEIDSGW